MIWCGVLPVRHKRFFQSPRMITTSRWGYGWRCKAVGDRMTVERMIEASSTLRDDVDSFADSLVKEGSVDVVYNPLAYAWEPHRAYLESAAGGGAKHCFLE